MTWETHETNLYSDTLTELLRDIHVAALLMSTEDNPMPYANRYAASVLLLIRTLYPADMVGGVVAEVLYRDIEQKEKDIARGI